MSIKKILIVLVVLLVGVTFIYKENIKNIMQPSSDIKTSFIGYLNSTIREFEKKDPTTKNTFSENDVVCTENSCSVLLEISQGTTKSSLTIKFKFENGVWSPAKGQGPEAPNTPEAQISEKLANRYNLSVYSKDDVALVVLVNGVQQDIFKRDSLDGSSISGLLYAVPGENNVEIKFVSKKSGEQDFTYSYELRGYPKDAEGVLFDDKYILSTSKKPGEFDDIVEGKITGTKSFKFSFKGE